MFIFDHANVFDLSCIFVTKIFKITIHEFWLIQVYRMGGAYRAQMAIIKIQLVMK